jgi:hypothetical protein
MMCTRLALIELIHDEFILAKYSVVGWLGSTKIKTDGEVWSRRPTSYSRYGASQFCTIVP